MSGALGTHVRERSGLRIATAHLTVTAGSDRLLDDVSLTIQPGELVAVVGASGAGKSTLLKALADAHGSQVGYVPQDDIVHTELPLRRTLRYAASLRLPAVDDVDRVVDATIDELGLADRRDVRVADLSGGQRKRASIAVELLRRPQALLVDEPTSGLDPATAASVVAVLRALAAHGCTVVFSTHSLPDLNTCDRLVVLGSGGHLAYSGPPTYAPSAFGVTDMAAVFACVADPDDARRWAEHHRRAQPSRTEGMSSTHSSAAPAGEPDASRPGWWRQWSALTSRAAEIIGRNRLTLAILTGSPTMVIAMFVILFRPGAFDAQPADPNALVMIAFWVAFGGFFFGLTAGLLQVCTEHPVLRRDLLAGVRPSAYVLSKVAVLTPFLAMVAVATLGILRVLDRLPALGAEVWATLLVTLLLDAIAALALGLATSAAVASPSQATLALPMLCFPAVLFSGAILPVEVMAYAGRAISVAMPDRWAYEAIAHDLGLADRVGAPWAVDRFAPTLPLAGTWAVLAAFAVALLALTGRLVARLGAADHG